MESSITLWHPRCITCGKTLGMYQTTYENLISQGFSPKDAMDKLGITRYCCRVRVLSPAQFIIGAQFDESNPSIIDIESIHPRENVISSPLVSLQQNTPISSITSIPTQPYVVPSINETPSIPLKTKLEIKKQPILIKPVTKTLFGHPKIPTLTKQ